MCIPRRQKSKSPLRFIIRNNNGGKQKNQDKLLNSTISNTSLSNQIKLIIKNRKLQSDSFELNLIELFTVFNQLFCCFLSNKNRQFPSLKYYLSLFLICLFVYSTALNPNSEFVHDDLVAIVRNQDCFNSPILDLFKNDFWGERMSSAASHKSYRPFTILTFRLNMQISKLWYEGDHLELNNISDQTDEQHLHRFSWTFKLVNVLLHSIATQLFFYILINHLFIDIKHAFLASLHYLLHPIKTEAVSSIVGRADLLAAIFMMITFIFYKRMLKPFKSSQMIDGIIFTCSSILGLLSKEIAITILPICIGHFIYKFYFIEQVFSSKNRTLTLKQAHKSNRLEEDTKSIKLYKFFNKNYPLLLNIVLLITLLSFRIWMLNSQLPIFTSQDNPAAFSTSRLTRFLTYAYLAAFNLFSLFNPSKLSYDWQMNSIPLIEQLSDLRNLLTFSLFAFLVLLVLTFLREKNKQNQFTLYFALLFLTLPYIPASNLLVTVGFVIAERTLYIPSIGFSTLFIYGLIKFEDYLNYQTNNSKKFKSYLKIAIYILFAMFALKTLTRNQDWLTRESLFKSGLRDLPHNAKIQYNYANLQKDLGHVKIAIQHYRLALRYWPNHESAHNNLAVLLDDPQEAEKHLLKALDLNPFHSRAYFNLANIYSKRGNHHHAITFLKKSINLNPNLAEAYSKLGSEYVNIKKYKIAMEYHQYALKLQPRNADFLNNYGVYLHQIGELEEAINIYKKAIQINSNHKKALENLKQLIDK